MTITSAFVRRPCRGETVCGDAVLVVDGPVACVAVVDGLGHGAQAAAAAQALVDFVAPRHTQPLPELLRGATAALHGTRGAAAVLAQFDSRDHTLRVAGVGNVEVYAAAHRRIAPVSSPGVLGRPIRKVEQFCYAVTRGDWFVFFTDGISRSLDLAGYNGRPLEETAELILKQHGKLWDDAACAVIRYEGAG